MTVAAIVQARMGSTRLPGKVLADLAGRPVLAWVVERARRIPGVDVVVVATSDRPEDDPLVGAARELAAPVVRGSERDVLGRFVLAARAHDAAVILRVTADCPLLSPSVQGAALERFQVGDVDYVNTWQARRHLPRGLDAEVFSRDALEAAGAEATLPPDREHVTPYLHRNDAGTFRVASIDLGGELSHHRWTVDEPADLELMRRIYGALDDPLADLPAVLAVVRAHPEWAALNQGVRQKRWGE